MMMSPWPSRVAELIDGVLGDRAGRQHHPDARGASRSAWRRGPRQAVGARRAVAARARRPRPWRGRRPRSGGRAAAGAGRYCRPSGRGRSRRVAWLRLNRFESMRGRGTGRLRQATARGFAVRPRLDPACGRQFAAAAWRRPRQQLVEGFRELLDAVDHEFVRDRRRARCRAARRAARVASAPSTSLLDRVRLGRAVVAERLHGGGRHGVDRVAPDDRCRRNRCRAAPGPWCRSRPRAGAAAWRPGRRAPATAAPAVDGLGALIGPLGIGDGDLAAHLVDQRRIGALQRRRASCRPPCRCGSGRSSPRSATCDGIAALGRELLQARDIGLGHVLVGLRPRTAASR